jgi:hypothetical protein
VRTLTVGKLGRARLWINEHAGATIEPTGKVSRCVSAGMNPFTCKRATIEAMLPRGARCEYGLLGIKIEQSQEMTDLLLEVTWSNEYPCQFVTPLARPMEDAHVGLPQEFASAVLEGLERGTRSLCAPGVVRVSEAAFGTVGSSPRIMRQLSELVAILSHVHTDSDDKLKLLLEEVLLRAG